MGKEISRPKRIFSTSKTLVVLTNGCLTLSSPPSLNPHGIHLQASTLLSLSRGTEGGETTREMGGCFDGKFGALCTMLEIPIFIYIFPWEEEKAFVVCRAYWKSLTLLMRVCYSTEIGLDAKKKKAITATVTTKRAFLGRPRCFYMQYKPKRGVTSLTWKVSPSSFSLLLFLSAIVCRRLSRNE